MIAVLAVIADHLFHWPHGGFVGVDVFFVISGYLITGLLLREWDRTGTISFRGFYRRRIKRIMPAAVLVVLATLAAAFLLFSSVRFDRTVTDGVWATFFSANWNFALQGTDYFAADQATSPLQHYWSLAVEEQFYFVWPWLMLLILWLIGRTVTNNDTARKTAHRSVFIAILVLTIASFAWALHESASNPTFAYFSTFSRAWELGIGALIAIIATAFTKIPDAIRPVLAWIGLAGIVLSLFVATDSAGFPAPGAALPVLATALVIIAGTGSSQARFLWPLTNPVSRYIGDISYSLYLWHFPAIIVAGEIFKEGSKRYYALALAIAFAGAILSYRLIENPIRKSRWLEPKDKKHPVRVTIWTAATLAICAAILTTTIIPTLRTDPVPAQAQTDVRLSLEDLKAGLAQAAQDQEWPDLVPSEEDLAKDGFGPGDAVGCKTAHRNGNDCDALKVDDPENTVLVVGNSSGAAYLPGIRAALEPLGWNVIALTMMGCPFLDAETSNANEALTEACPENKAHVISAIQRIQPGLIISSSLYVPQLTAAQRGAAQDSLLNQLQGSYGAYVLLSPAPSGPAIVECKTARSHPADCMGEANEMWLSQAEAESAVADAHDDVYFVNGHDWFCTKNDKCPPYVGNVPVKRDNTHLSTAFSASLADVLLDSLASAGVDVSVPSVP